MVVPLSAEDQALLLVIVAFIAFRAIVPMFYAADRADFPRLTLHIEGCDILGATISAGALVMLVCRRTLIKSLILWLCHGWPP